MERYVPDERLADWETPPETATPIWYQQRGRAFEKIINGVLTKEDLQPRTSFRPTGEEIDGSFVFGERTYLFEAKWRKDPIPASDLYAFKGKVDGKLTGTLGVFISMSGYSDDAIDALKFGKEINLILFDGRDFRLVVEGKPAFSSAMREKLRYAAEEGQPFLPLSPQPDAAEPAAVDLTGPPTTRSEEQDRWNLVVESDLEAIGLRIVLGRLDPRLVPLLRFWSAGGQLGIVSLLRTLRRSGHTHIAAVVPSDISVDVLDEIKVELAATGGPVLQIDPNLEEWMEGACPTEYVNMAPATGTKEKAMRRVAAHADLDQLAKSNPQLSEFVKQLQRVVD